MTALCGGGTSGAKPGYAAVIEYSAGALALVLASRGLGWLTPAIPLLGLTDLTLSAFCGTDPPASPTFTSAESKALLGLNFGADFDSGLAKAKDLALYAIWNEICECTSGTPAAPTYPAPPSGTPIFLPPPYVANTPCDTVPLRTVTSFVGPSPGLLTAQPIRYVVFRWTNTILTGAGGTYRVSLGDWFSKATPGPTLTLLGSNVYFIVPGEVQKQVVALPVGTNFVRPDVTFSSGTGTSTIQYQLDGYCGDTPPDALSTPCCPPDVATQASLDILVKLVTLIQRQSVPFGYVASSVHAGLSGAGVLDISGLIGAKVAVTTLPDPLGREGTAPTEYFDMGWLTFGTADGYPSAYRLERSSQILLPARCGAYTELAYDLHPGVVVTITELVREP